MSKIKYKLIPFVSDSYMSLNIYMKNHQCISKPIDVHRFLYPLNKKQCDRYENGNGAIIPWMTWRKYRDKYLK